jgi:hypothetical protein
MIDSADDSLTIAHMAGFERGTDQVRTKLAEAEAELSDLRAKLATAEEGKRRATIEAGKAAA